MPAAPVEGDDRHDAASITRHWTRLHAGDAEPLPEAPEVLDAWVLYHNGDFREAVEAGLQAGSAGLTVANKAASIYANYLEQQEGTRLELLLATARRAEAQAADDPQNPNAWFWQAYALGCYTQNVSVAKALAQGLGGKVKAALERTIALQPRHADAHVALGSFHAEVIDKVGSLIGAMTFGARKEAGLALFRQGLQMHPESPIGLIEYAKGLVMLEGDPALPEATRLYRQAAGLQPLDAKERLDVESARAELGR